jgi:2-polyprenyl-6-methoxyphenol hydroxylase-like FAD-dependent oxidoreductase
MRYADIAIAGGGLAGSMAAAMLGRAGFDVVLIDPHPVYPVDFRCEKLDARHVRVLQRTPLAEPLMRAMTHDQNVWIARFGRLVERRPSDQYGIRYDDLVNAVRAQIPNQVTFFHAKATGITTSADRQRITLSNGEEVTARLVIMANGLNIGMRREIGMTREMISECHSISIGFDIAPVGRNRFDFSALTYHAERVSDRAALLTLFPIGSTMRANLFVYRDMQDPWLRQLRASPQEVLFRLMPGLRELTGDFEVSEPIRIRPVDLYVTRGHRRAGIVVVGDAFATSCPAAGTGAFKVVTDVERLCNVHAPRWLATPGMGEEKIASFYDDAVKQACDRYCAHKAFFLRSFSIDPGFPWRLRRGAKFVAGLGAGTLRATIERLAPSSWGRSEPGLQADSPPLIPAQAGAEQRTDSMLETVSRRS